MNWCRIFLNINIVQILTLTCRMNPLDDSGIDGFQSLVFDPLIRHSGGHKPEISVKSVRSRTSA